MSKRIRGDLCLGNARIGQKVRCIHSAFPEVLVCGEYYYVYANLIDEDGNRGVVVGTNLGPSNRVEHPLRTKQGEDIAFDYDNFTVVQRP
jgi:hypothetical protein